MFDKNKDKNKDKKTEAEKGVQMPDQSKTAANKDSKSKSGKSKT